MTEYSSVIGSVPYWFILSVKCRSTWYRPCKVQFGRLDERRLDSQGVKTIHIWIDCGSQVMINPVESHSSGAWWSCFNQLTNSIITEWQGFCVGRNLAFDLIVRKTIFCRVGGCNFFFRISITLSFYLLTTLCAWWRLGDERTIFAQSTLIRSVKTDRNMIADSHLLDKFSTKDWFEFDH